MRGSMSDEEAFDSVSDTRNGILMTGTMHSWFDTQMTGMLVVRRSRNF